MGDDESFDLDDELGLGDDGDDFGDPLDNMLDDDDDGGDGGNDSGLDAFFEDLSNIDEMDGGETPEPSAAPTPMAAAAPAAAMAAPAAAAMAAPAAKKKGGMMKWLIILIILGGAGYGGWWYMNKEETSPVEAPPELVDSGILSNDNGGISVEDTELPQPPQAPKQSITRPKVVAPPPKVVRVPKQTPVAASGRYLVQVATCTFAQCRDEYAGKLRNAGKPVYFKKSGSKHDFVEVLSKEMFNLRDAQMWVEKINQKNERTGVASVQYKANGHRVTMGTFTSLERAKDAKIYLEEILNSELRFNMEYVQQNYETIKIFAGPFDTRSQAKSALRDIKQTRNFPGAFIVRK